MSALKFDIAIFNDTIYWYFYRTNRANC